MRGSLISMLALATFALIASDAWTKPISITESQVLNVCGGDLKTSSDGAVKGCTKGCGASKCDYSCTTSKGKTSCEAVVYLKGAIKVPKGANGGTDAASAAEDGSTTTNKNLITIGPLSTTGGLLNRPGGVVDYNVSDCRLDGGTVVTPSDDRCGKTGAVYCRKPDGVAQCIDEQ